ncbi:GNAT family N-acetyltransferase [Streptosporangium sp. NPDC002524]|uniref:GNAT family N-acetyltransferase n=1 Tax=Streptosporangium sp. NPDC002524 TaxID=3154537 RepID=UPI0033176608
MGTADIRQATGGDLPAMVRSLGQEEYFSDRLALQDSGHGLLLVAWQEGVTDGGAGDVAVGDVYVWLAAAEEAELRAHLPHVALLTHLEVVAGRRNEGIGTELLRAAEHRLWDLGHKQVALGVGLDNRDAQRLYARLGYTEWPHGQVATTEVVYHPGGERELRPEICRIMVRQLDPERGGPWR